MADRDTCTVADGSYIYDRPTKLKTTERWGATLAKGKVNALQQWVQAVVTNCKRVTGIERS